VLAAKPEDVRQLRPQINKSYGSGYGLGVWLDVQNVLRGDGGREERKQYLTHRLSELRQDAPHVNENITDMLTPGMALASAAEAAAAANPADLAGVPGRKNSLPT
jgi:hypothetical protein